MRFHLTSIHRRPHYPPLGKPQVSMGRTPPILQGCGGVTSLCDGSQLQRGWGRERRGAADRREGLFLGLPPAASVCPPPTVTRGPFSFLPMLPLLHLRRSWGKTLGCLPGHKYWEGVFWKQQGMPTTQRPRLEAGEAWVAPHRGGDSGLFSGKRTDVLGQPRGL